VAILKDKFRDDRNNLTPGRGLGRVSFGIARILPEERRKTYRFASLESVLKPEWERFLDKFCAENQTRMPKPYSQHSLT